MLENPRRVLHCFHQDLSASACPVYEKVIYIELRFAVKHRVDGVQDKCVETGAGYSAKYLAVVPVGHCAPAGNHALEGERLQRHQRLQHITVHVFELVDMFQGQSTETAFLEAFPADGAQNQTQYIRDAAKEVVLAVSYFEVYRRQFPDVKQVGER